MLAEVATQMIPLAAIERDVLIMSCAISAGIHAALVREHFTQGTGAIGSSELAVVRNAHGCHAATDA